jgi:hypothetical protein
VQRERTAPPDRITIPLYAGEREALTASAERYERTVVEEARYRLRRWLRPPGLAQAPAEDVFRPATTTAA